MKKKSPLLSQHHKHEWMDFALSHRHWTIEDWKRVVWSDETKINQLGSDGQKWVWKSAGEALSDCLVEGTQKFGGGSLMMWGYMTWEGPGYVCKIDGRMISKEPSIIMANPQVMWCSSRTMTPSTPAGRPRPGSKTMVSMS